LPPAFLPRIAVAATEEAVTRRFAIPRDLPGLFRHTLPQQSAHALTVGKQVEIKPLFGEWARRRAAALRVSAPRIFSN
jgi:hypothetical protein